MNTCLYARVSTRDRDQNPDTQLVALREEARRRGWEVVGEYVDQASAGDLQGRTAWARLLRDARTGEWDAVAVVRLDRAFRSVVQMNTDLSRLAACGRGFVCTTQPIDITTAMGRFTLTVLAAVAEFERDLISQRVREGMDRARKEGKHLGRPVGARNKRPRASQKG